MCDNLDIIKNRLVILNPSRSNKKGRKAKKGKRGGGS